MVNSASNYMNSIGSMYQYNYNVMRSTSSQYNTAGIEKSKDTQKSSYVNSDAVSYLTDIRSGAERLLSALNSTANSSAFSKMQAVSANNEYLTVNDSSKPTAGFRDTEVEVKQVATEQVNQGTALESNEQIGDSPGTRSFEIEQGGNTYQFSIEVGENDTNRDIQQRMADAVNSRDIGVTAAVSQNENGTSQLTFQSENTGADARNSFTVRDVEGDLAARTGVDRTTQAAQNAVYRINNGATQTSGTNNINIGNGVSVKLNQATEGAVTVRAQNNTKAQTDDARNLVEGFNRLLESAQNGPANNRLQNDLNTMRNSYAASLQRIGITADDKGKLQIDSEKLGKAAENGTLSSFFNQTNSANYGFTNRLTRIAENVTGNSASYNSTINAQSDRNTQNVWQSAINNYKQSVNNYSFAYSYNAPGTLFNLYG